MPVANYLECGSELKIKVDLAYPLNASEEDMKDVEAPQVDEVWGLINVQYITCILIWGALIFGYLWKQVYKRKHVNSANDSK